MRRPTTIGLGRVWLNEYLLIRSDGPARELADGSKYWYDHRGLLFKYEIRGFCRREYPEDWMNSP